MATPTPIRVKIDISPDNKCGFCTSSTCCTYLTQQIDGPRSMEDFDTLLWQVSHQNTQVYRDKDGWFLLIDNRCDHLLPDGRCDIYETRPQICREHASDDCEFDGPAGKDDFELLFSDYRSLLAYCKKRFKNWDKWFQKASGGAKKRAAG